MAKYQTYSKAEAGKLAQHLVDQGVYFRVFRQKSGDAGPVVEVSPSKENLVGDFAKQNNTRVDLLP